MGQNVIYAPQDIPKAAYFPSGIYMQAVLVDEQGRQIPMNAYCRKVHLSSDVDSAEMIAAKILPLLADLGVNHKVVKNRDLLLDQSNGDQAGKFITMYMTVDDRVREDRLTRIGQALEKLQKTGGVKPCPRVPRARSYHHVFIERPLDRCGFLYGGLECTNCATP